MALSFATSTFALNTAPRVVAPRAGAIKAAAGSDFCYGLPVRPNNSTQPTCCLCAMRRQCTS